MRLAYLATASAILALAACSDAGTPTQNVGGGGGGVGPVPVATVEVSPPSPSVIIGKILILQAVAKDASGNALAGRQVTWASSNANIASVANDGTVSGMAAGSAQITATSEGKSGAATVSVVVAPVAGVSLNSTSVSLVVSGTYQLSATLQDADGNVLSGRTVTWSSANDAVATVSASGLVTAVAAGATQVTANSEGKSAQATITVSAPSPVPVSTVSVALAASSIQSGSTTQATATLKDANGNTLSGRSITWSSSNTAVARVNASGVVTAVSAGSATITASSEGKSGSASLTVTPAPVSTVAVSLAASTIETGKTTQATATLKDVSGNTLTGRTVTWSSSNAAVATVNASGLVTGVTAGSATITATSEGQSGSGNLTVIVPPVATVAVQLNATSLQVGQTTQASASLKDASGATLTGRSITWSSSNTGVATVNSSGLVTAVATGTASVRATSEGKTGSASLTVTSTSGGSTLALECNTPGTGWIFCDDFESDRSGSYFEVDNASGSFARTTGVGVDGSSAMKATWTTGQLSAGSLKLAFGRTPDSYMRPVDAGTTNYREVYWRLFVKNQAGWTGGSADKLSRAVVFANANWAEAAIGHVWGGDVPYTNNLSLDPASGTDASGTLKTTQYNDFANLTWLGSAPSQTTIFDASHVGQWYCVEAHMRLNDAGQSNGTFELWINGQLEAQRTGLNWLGSYNAYGINSILVENYWNTGSPQAQSRYIDNFVLSTQPIGCGTGSTPPPPPAPVATVTVSPSSPSISVGSTQQLSTTLRDASGNVLSGRAVAWSSSNTGVASVSSSGLVTGLTAGSATVTATSEGQSGTAAVTVTTSPPVTNASCGNEPSGMTPLINTAWNAVPPLQPNRDAEGWGYEYTANELSIIQDATAPKSPNSVLRTTFPGGMPGGGGPATFDNIFPNQKVVYVCIFLRRSANWTDNGNAGTKHFFLYTPYAGTANYTHVFIAFNGDRTDYFGLESGNQSAVPNIDYTGPQEPPYGAWHKYEYLFVANSPSSANGTFTAWRDGQQIMSRTNMRYFPSGVTPAFNMIQWAPTYGGGTNPVPATQYIDVDHWYVSGQP